MRIRKLAIAALIAAAPTATSFAQSALDQSVPRVSPTTAPRVSPTTPSPANTRLNHGDTTRTRNCDHSRGTPERVTCERSFRREVRCRQRPKTNNPGDTRAIGAPPPTR